MEPQDIQLKPPHKSPASVSRSAALFGAGTLVSRFLGFFRDALIANVFHRDMTDVFYLALKLPNLFRRILGEGALSFSFIPVFTGLKDRDPEASRALFHALFTLLLVITLSISLLAWFFMEPLIGVLAGGRGFTDIPGKLEMAVQISRVCFFFLIFITGFAVFMALLNGLRKFGWTGLAPAFLNLALISAGLWAWLGGDSSPWVLAWALVFGGLLQMLVLLPDVIRSGYAPKLNWDWRSPHLKSVFKAFGPSLIGLGSLQITALINIHFATRLDAGTVTYIYMADRLLELPLSLIAVSLQTALLPTLSQFWVNRDVRGMLDCSERHLKLNYALTIPAAVGMFVLSLPMVSTLFGWGSYAGKELVITAQVVQVYAFTLLTASGTRIVAQNFYAMGNTLLPGLVGATVTGAHFFIASFLTGEFGLLGLNLATLISSFFNLVLLLFFQRLKTGTSYFKGALDYFKMMMASGFMGLTLWWSLGLWGATDGKILQMLLLGVQVGVGALIYLVILRMSGFSDLNPILDKLRSRLKI